jgi:hypothetical protein
VVLFFPSPNKIYTFYLSRPLGGYPAEFDNLKNQLSVPDLISNHWIAIQGGLVFFE